MDVQLKANERIDVLHEMAIGLSRILISFVLAWMRCCSAGL